ncbi:MAG: hypothetical protein DWB93_06445 [Candidatus Poseidoniales archaeon]|nr:MAG: hypothetical protein DWB93_06445 [Candidatus Poseidoniales archaeon]
MSEGAFCITCGAETPLTSDRLCEKCFRKRNNLSTIPERIQQYRCPKCNKYEIGGRWSEIDNENLADLRIRENLKIYPESTEIDLGFSIEEIDNRSVRLHIGINGKIEGYLFQDNHTSLMQTSNAVCPACTRKAGSYFESIVQLRSAGRKLNSSEIKEVRNTLDDMLSEMEPDPMFFITSEGPVTGGWDMQLGSKAMARSWGKRLTQRFGGTIKETSTVVGANDGIEVTRLTMSYRKPAYSIGDVIKLKGDLWLVSRWQKDGPILRRMSYFERKGVSWRDMEKCMVICSLEDQYIVDILNRDSSAVEIMDPVDYKIVTVALPYDDDNQTSKIRIGFIGDTWLAIPGTNSEV